MENKNIVMIKHSAVNIKLNSAFYLNQLDKEMNYRDVIFIDVTSRSRDKEFAKQVSPFFIGPVKSSDGLECKIFENFWQFSKVYKGDTIFRKKLSSRKGEEIRVNLSDVEGNPTDEWFELRKFGFNEKLAYRRPYEGTPLYQYYVKDGKVERLNYIEARKKVYIPEYAKLVVNTEAYKKLEKLVEEGKIVALVDFDAYNYDNRKYMEKRYNDEYKRNKFMKNTVRDYLRIRKMKDVVNCPFLTAGHGFVLKMLLQKDIEVVNGEVIDNIGILD